MSAALAHYALAELRGSARVLGFFVGCLAVGVGAVVAVKGTSSGIEAGVRAHARELLGADAVVQSWRALPEVSSALAETGARMTLVKEMVTLVARVDGRQPGRSQLVELRAVGAGYPFYGPPRLEPDRRLGELLDRETTVVADELLDRMGLGVGDTLRIGGQDFRIAGRVLSEADTLSGSLRLGPRVFVSTDGLARTSLEAFGSRILRRALVKLPPGGRLADAERLVARLRERWKERDDLRIETYRDMQPAVRRTIDRMEPYLALVALVSLLLGGIGVGQGIRVWIRQRLGSVAILKALGVRPRQVLTLYLIQTLLLAAVGSGLGILLGLAVPRLLPALLGEALPPGILRPAVMGPILHGLAIGAGVAVLFSLGPLLAVWRVPPLRVLRRDAEPLPLPRIPRILGLILLFLGVAGVASVLSGSVRRGTVFVAGLLLAAGLLAAAARGLAHVAFRLARRSGPVAVRYGALALGRPGADTLGGVTALGLGLTVVVALGTVERHLTRDLGRDLPGDAPTAFLVDIQPDQWERVRTLLESAGGTRIDSVPVVSGRLRAIDGRRAMEIARERAPDRRWSLTREQRLTYLQTLPESNTVTQGRLWSEPARAEISLEEEFAESLGVGLGSALTFDIQGLPVDFAVTSLRRVDWRSFGINFFAVAEPGVLEAAPQMRLAAVRLPEAVEQQTQDRLAAAFPNVTVLLVRDVLEKVSAIIQRLALGVRLLGAFTFVAGLGILAAAFHVSGQKRRREVALLKTLGFTRGQVLAAVAVEHALVGATAGLIGVAAGSGLGWLVLRYALDLRWEVSVGPAALAVLATVALTGLASLTSTVPTLRTRPAATLRQ